MQLAQLFTRTTTGTILADGPGSIVGAQLIAGSDAATCVIRDGGATGTILAKLVAAPNDVANFFPALMIRYATDVHVTLTGTGPRLNLFA